MAVCALFIAGCMACAQTSGYLEPSWEYRANDYINKVEIADLNGDGVNEILASSRDGILYDLGHKVSGHVNWQTIVGGNIRDFQILDYDKDGNTEVLVGSDKIGVSVRLLDWQGLNHGSTVDFEERVYAIDAADVDGDGVNDLVLGGLNRKVSVIKSQVLPPLWEYESLGAVQYINAGDLDGDSKTEIVAVSSWSLNEDDLAQLYVLNNAGKLLWAYDIPGGIPSTSNSPAAVADLNGDGNKEIIVGGVKGVTVLDFAGTVLWSYNTEKQVNVVYVPGSGSQIFLGATPYVYSLDGAGKLIWKYPVNTTVLSINVADINSDGRIEVLVGANNYIHILSEDATPILSWFNNDMNAISSLKGKNFQTRSLTAGDVDGDGAMEIVAGFGWTEGKAAQNYNSGLVEVFNVNSGALVTTLAPSTTKVQETGGRTTTQAATTKPAATRAPTTTEPGMLDDTTLTEVEEKPSGGNNTLLILGIVAVGGLVILAAIVLVLFVLWRKKNPPKKKDGPAKLSGA